MVDVVVDGGAPKPCSSLSRPSFENSRLQAELTHAVQRVHATLACTDDENIVVQRRVQRRWWYAVELPNHDETVWCKAGVYRVRLWFWIIHEGSVDESGVYYSDIGVAASYSDVPSAV